LGPEVDEQSQRPYDQDDGGAETEPPAACPRLAALITAPDVDRRFRHAPHLSDQSSGERLILPRTGRSTFRLLEPLGDIPHAEAEANCYAALAQSAMAA